MVESRSRSSKTKLPNVSTDKPINKLTELFMILATRIPFLTAYGIIAGMIRGDVKTILDIGCGKGVPMMIINRNLKYEVTGVDMFQPYLDQAKKLGVYKRLIKADARKLPFQKDQFDVVLCLGMIEHLTKKEGVRLLKDMERIAKKKVIIWAPVGFYPQGEIDDNPFQVHECAWEPSEFKKLGYKVVGQGLKYLYGKRNIVEMFGPMCFLVFLILMFFQPLVFFKPELGLNMYCLKDLTKSEG